MLESQFGTTSVSEARNLYKGCLLHGTVSYRPVAIEAADPLAMEHPLLWTEKIRYCLEKFPEIAVFPVFQGRSNYYWSGVGLIVKEGQIKCSGTSYAERNGTRRPESTESPYEYSWGDMLIGQKAWVYELVVANPEFEAIYYNPQEIKRAVWDRINNSLNVEDVIEFSKKEVGLPVYIIDDSGMQKRLH